MFKYLILSPILFLAACTFLQQHPEVEKAAEEVVEDVVEDVLKHAESKS